MKRALILLFLLVLSVSCRDRQKESEKEPVSELMGGKPVVVELVTGSVLELELTMEEPDAYILKGHSGTGRFPKALVRRISDAPAERPLTDLPGKDLLRKKRAPGAYVAKSSGRTFHKRGCRQALRISGPDRVEFQTREEAIRRGFKPCGVCNP